MSRRSRRAAAAVSSSASTTMRPPTMCRPPANRSIADTSALRSHGLMMVSRLSSSFTKGVNAMGAILPPNPYAGDGAGSRIALLHDVAIRRRQPQRVMAVRVVRVGEVGQHELAAERLSDLGQAGRPVHAAVVGEYDVDIQQRCVHGQ